MDLEVAVDDDRPLFLQIAEAIEDQILSGALKEETQVPSINELAAFYRINPATALKGINRLVDGGVLYKRRGIGMFVADGAREQLRGARKQAFRHDHVDPMARAARSLGLPTDDVIRMIREEMGS